MVFIPAGSFQMGDSFGEGDSDEKPVHTVFVSAFYMDKYEVTKALWDEVASWAAANGYDIGPAAGDGKGPNHPVYNVTWYEAVKWANARSEREGLTPCYYTSATQATVYRTGDVNVRNDWVKWSWCGYRLPTEAEWEKAARGGVAGRRFPWSDTNEIRHARANYFSSASYSYDTSPTRGYHPTYAVGNHPYTSPVGSFAPNGYGLYDMAGNVWEWVWDWHFGDYYSSGVNSDPRGPAAGSSRVLRGGGWNRSASYCRVASRNSYGPDSCNSDFGFRAERPAGQ
jgi:formylglycine-generating enzyme required for sulfatase activity